MNRGEIRWCSFSPPDKKRPVLVLSRNEVAEKLNEVIVVPITRTIRGLVTEVLLGTEDGMPANCALNFDLLSIVQRDQLGARIAFLPAAKWEEVRRALLHSCGFREQMALSVMPRVLMSTAFST